MATYDPSASYRILNRQGGAALSVRRAGRANGSVAIVFRDVDAEDQLWHIVHVGHGFHVLYNNHSGRVLSTLNGGTAAGTTVHLWDYLTTFPDQEWIIEPSVPGVVTIANRNGERVVSCVGGGSADDTGIELADRVAGAVHQEWSIVGVVPRIRIEPSQAIVVDLSPYMTGACLEDVNHEVYGGLHSQMIFGESFQEPPAYDPATLYKIVNLKDGRLLSIDKGRSERERRAIVWDEVRTPDQLWRILDVGNGFWGLFNFPSGLALSTVNGGSANGTPVHLFDYLQTFPDQHWAIGAGEGPVHIRNRKERRLLSCEGGLDGTFDGTKLHLFELIDRATDQLWQIAPVTAPMIDPAIPCRIRNRKSGKLLSVLGGGEANGTRVVLRDQQDQPHELWRIEFIGDGYYRLRNVKSGRLLSTLDGRSEDATIIHIWDDFTTFPDQHWMLTPVATPGFVKITNRTGFGTVSCFQGGVANDTTIHLFHYLHGFPDQDWMIEPTTVRARPGVSGMWRGFRTGSTVGSFALEPVAPRKGVQSQGLTFSGGSGEVGIENRSLNRWGMHVAAGARYEGVVSLKTSSPTTVHLAFEAADGPVFGETSVVTDASAQWRDYSFALTPVASSAARFAIKLKAPGSVHVGYVRVERAAADRPGGLPVRRDLAEALVTQGNTFVRFGGSAVNHPDYRWAHMIGPRERRPATAAFWYPFGSHGWQIVELLDLAEWASMAAVPTLNVFAETPETVAHFIEYVNGPSATPGGRDRVNTGHPLPYGVRFIELGNEEAIDRAYGDRFELLAPVLWGRDPNVILIVGDFMYEKKIADPWNFPGNRKTHSLETHVRLLQIAAQHGRELWFDCHMWTDEAPGDDGPVSGDVKVREQVAALESLAHHLATLSSEARFKLVVFELNAARYDHGRALNNALALGLLQRLGRTVRMVAAANALQPYDQNDNGWDQGMLFFDPSRAWAQPPYYVTRMKADGHLPLVVRATISGRESDTLDVTALMSADRRALTLHVVNLIGVSRAYAIDLGSFVPATNVAQVTTLAGPLSGRNSADTPGAIVPTETLVPYTRAGNTVTFTVAPTSFTVLRLS